MSANTYTTYLQNHCKLLQMNVQYFANIANYCNFIAKYCKSIALPAVDRPVCSPVQNQKSRISVNMLMFHSKCRHSNTNRPSWCVLERFGKKLKWQLGECTVILGNCLSVGRSLQKAVFNGLGTFVE